MNSLGISNIMAMRVWQRCFLVLVLVRRFSVCQWRLVYHCFHDRVQLISSHRHSHEPRFVLAVYPFGCYRSQVEWVSVSWEVVRHLSVYVLYIFTGHLYFPMVAYILGFALMSFTFTPVLVLVTRSLYYRYWSLSSESRQRRTSPQQICLCSVPPPFMPNCNCQTVVEPELV